MISRYSSEGEPSSLPNLPYPQEDVFQYPRDLPGPEQPMQGWDRELAIDAATFAQPKKKSLLGGVESAIIAATFALSSCQAMRPVGVERAEAGELPGPALVIGIDPTENAFVAPVTVVPPTKIYGAPSVTATPTETAKPTATETATSTEQATAVPATETEAPTPTDVFYWGGKYFLKEIPAGGISMDKLPTGTRITGPGQAFSRCDSEPDHINKHRLNGEYLTGFLPNMQTTETCDYMWMTKPMITEWINDVYASKPSDYKQKMVRVFERLSETVMDAFQAQNPYLDGYYEYGIRKIDGKLTWAVVVSDHITGRGIQNEIFIERLNVPLAPLPTATPMP